MGTKVRKESRNLYRPWPARVAARPARHFAAPARIWPKTQKNPSKPSEVVRYPRKVKQCTRTNLMRERDRSQKHKLLLEVNVGAIEVPSRS